MKRTLKGFTLVEMIIVVIVLAMVTVSCAMITQSVAAVRTQAKHSVYLSLHHLNVMESLRQEMNTLGETKTLNAYYGPPGASTGMTTHDFSTADISTQVFVETTTWDNFHIYSVRIESKVNGYTHRLTSSYVLTDIGIQAPVVPVVAPT